ncbi:YveK family protein [Lacticigenium naphthae]|uniref:YveK family protein n=1 Tax=Lacticigenium naphthae TaxID=515351 RepID=UPI0003FE221E|nr:Wzz/FepE/Etk N-terminal domain-containing protein [Lacticigenium naphthae]
MEEEISLVEIWQMLKKRLGMIFSIGIAGLALAAIYTLFIAVPQYSSTTQMLVNRPQTGETIQASDINTNLQLINTYKDIIKGPVILDGVREGLDVEFSHTQLSDKIQVANQDNSQVFSLTVTDDNPYRASEIANSVAETFQNEIDDIMKVDNVTIISAALPNTSPISPNNLLNMVIGLILGLMIGVGLAFVLAFLDTSVKDDKFISQELGWVNLGKISEMTTDELKSDPRKSELQKHSRTARTRV